VKILYKQMSDRWLSLKYRFNRFFYAYRDNFQ
jgi:hypothetical protein